MSRSVESIREELLVEEKLHKIEQENSGKLQDESSKEDSKIFKQLLIVAGLSNIVFLPVFYIAIPHYNILSPIFFSFVASGSLFILMMFVYTVFFSNPTPVIDVEGWRSKIAYLKKIRKLEFELLIATTSAKIIRVINDELGKEWHNMILEINGEAREYYVSFPRDEKGYASVEYYEFIPGKASKQ